MDPLTQVAELHRKLSSFPSPVSPDCNSPQSEKEIEFAKQNGYVLYASQGGPPKVYLIGFTHKGGTINQEDQLERILKKSLMTGDVVLMEGDGPFEAVYEGYHSNDIIGKLKDFFSGKGIRTIYNDDRGLIVKFMLAANRKKKADDKYGINSTHPAYVEAIKNWLETLKERDQNFCCNPLTGIIPLARCTANIYKQPEQGAIIYQLVGVLHVYNEMVRHLKESGVNFMCFVPDSKFF